MQGGSTGLHWVFPIRTLLGEAAQGNPKPPERGERERAGKPGQGVCPAHTMVAGTAPGAGYHGAGEPVRGPTRSREPVQQGNEDEDL